MDTFRLVAFIAIATVLLAVLVMLWSLTIAVMLAPMRRADFDRAFARARVISSSATNVSRVRSN